MRILIFANPIAGCGQGAAVARAVGDALKADGYHVDTFLGPADAVERCGDDAAAAIVIGGDGTLRAVAQWAIDTAARMDLPPASGCCTPCPLLIVPMGTANLMGRHLGVKWDMSRLPAQVAGALRRRRLLKLDAARTDRGVFLLMAGVGVDAWIVRELDRARSGPIGGKTTYLTPGLRALARYAFPPIEVRVDDQLIFPAAPAVAMIGNVAEYGAGFPILPYARPDDQTLDVCVMPCADKRELLNLFIAAAGGGHLGFEGVVYVKGKHVKITAPAAVPVQVDGEPAGFTPIAIDLLPGRVPFIVP